jgi:hypothetical protein
MNQPKPDESHNMILTDDRMEYILLNRLMMERSKYITILEPFYDGRWLENKSIKVCTDFIFNYYNKYGECPKEKVLNLLLEKYEQVNAEKVTPGDLKRTLTSAVEQDMTVFKDDFIEENVITYVKNKCLLFSITDNFDSITNDHDVSKCLETFQRVDGLSLNQDVGMDYFEDWEEHEEYLTNPEGKIATGWKGFDDVTYGGLIADGKCLIVPIAQAGLGKSLFVSNLSVNLLEDNKTVLIVSLEMSEDIYAMRIDSHISGENINMLSHNITSVKEKVYDFKNEKAESKLIIKEFPPDSLNCNQLKLYIERLELFDMKPDVVMVDYISLMKSNSSNKDEMMYVRVGNIAKELRALSYHFKVPFVAPQQINGDGYDATNISMSNMSESKAINHHADFIGAMFQAEGDREANKINMVVLKNRLGGQLGSIIEWHIDYEDVSLRMIDWNDPANRSVTPLTFDDETGSVADEVLNNLNDI